MEQKPNKGVRQESNDQEKVLQAYVGVRSGDSVPKFTVAAEGQRVTWSTWDTGRSFGPLSS